MNKATFWLASFLVAFTLYTHIVPQIAEWRYYASDRGECTGYYKVDGEHNYREHKGHRSYGADFMWSRLKWDFYNECM